MHCIHKKEFELEDFSYEHLIDMEGYKGATMDDIDIPMVNNVPPYGFLVKTIKMLNKCREKYLETGNKKYWWQMIQLLPSSYNQKRTIMLNYEVLANIYKSRKNHKLDEWKEHYESTCTIDTIGDCLNQKEYLLCEDCMADKGLCDWIKTLPYSELITD